MPFLIFSVVIFLIFVVVSIDKAKLAKSKFKLKLFKGLIADEIMMIEGDYLFWKLKITEACRELVRSLYNNIEKKS